MKINEMRELSIDELNDKIIEFKKELFECKIARANHKLEDESKIGSLKNKVAQAKTVIREKELQEKKQEVTNA